MLRSLASMAFLARSCLSAIFPVIFFLSVCQNVFSSQLQTVRVAVVTDNTTNFSIFHDLVLAAIHEVNASETGVALHLGPVVLSSHPNPMDVYRQTCDRLGGTDVSAVVVQADERTQFSLSVAGGFLGVPVIGLSNRAFAFSNKEVHPLFLRLGVSITNQAHVIQSLLHRNAWFNFSVVASDGEGSDAFVQSIRDLIQGPGWNIRHDIRFPVGEASSSNMLLRSLADDASYVVMVLHCSPKEAQNVFRAANEFKLLGKGHALIGTESLMTDDPKILIDYPTGLLIVKHYDPAPLKDHLHDAFTLVARAAKTLKWDGGSRNISCWKSPDSNQLVYANNFYRTMTNTSFKGNLGDIHFNQNGDLLDSSYHVLNLVQESPIVHAWKEVGSWRKGALNLETVVWPGNTMVMPVGVDTHKLIIATNTEKPFIFYSESMGIEGDCTTGVKCLLAKQNTDRRDFEKAFEEFRRKPDGGNYSAMQRCCTGLCVDLILRMSQDLNFKYDLYLVADENHGAMENGTWNGMVGDLIYGKADAAISSFSITRERSAVIDFTAPFFHSGFSTLVAKKQRQQTLGAFLAPLHPNVWMLIFASAVVMAFCLTISEWMSPYGLHPKGRNRNSTFSFPSALTITYAILFSNTIKTKPPKCMTSRMLLNVWGGFSLIFFSSYTANLAAFLAGQMSYLSIEDINDPKLQNPTIETTIGTVTGSSIQNYLRSLNPNLDAFMGTYVQHSTEQAIQNLKSGELDVFIYDSPVIEYRMANDPECSLVSVGKPFGEEGYGIGIPKGSPLRDTISGKILEYELDGILEELQRKWFESTGCMKEDILDPTAGGEDNTVTIAHVGGLLLLLVSGMVIACLILLIEIAAHKWLVPYLRKLPKHRRDCLVFSQVECTPTIYAMHNQDEKGTNYYGRERLHHEINSDYKVRSSANIRELLTLVKQGEFAKMLQKEQRPAAPEEIEARRDIRQAVQAGIARRAPVSGPGLPHLQASDQQEYLRTMDECDDDRRRPRAARTKRSWRPYDDPSDDGEVETEMDRLIFRDHAVPARRATGEELPGDPKGANGTTNVLRESHINMVSGVSVRDGDLEIGGVTPYNSIPTDDVIPPDEGAAAFDFHRDSFASGAYETDDLLSFMSDELAQCHLEGARLASPETDCGHSSTSSEGGEEQLPPCEGATLPRTSSLPSYNSAMNYPSTVFALSSGNTSEEISNNSTRKNSSYS